MMKFAKITLALGFLAGCGVGPLAQDVPFARFGTAVTGFVMSGQQSGNPAAAASPSVGLTREAIEGSPVNLLRLSLISLESTDVLAEVGVNGTRTTWMSSDGLSFTFDGGLLVGSRGTGFDLMGANVAGAKASLRRGGTHARTHEYLNSLDQIEQMTFQCRTVVTGQETLTIFERSYATSVVEETCTAGEVSFKNTYWRDRLGTIWQARQWISADRGYLGFQRL